MENLAGLTEGVPERFSPEELQGELLEAEHVVRYRWAASLAAGRRVLDAGCGTAYGTSMLGRAGATEVVGVDIAVAVLDSARPGMPDNVRLEPGDLNDLPFPDGGFDLVVCFEAIEHFADPFSVLDELTRVLAPGGVLLVSSPNREAYPPGNPHHHHEFLPAELEAELRTRLPNVRLLRQHAYVTAAVLDDETYAGAADEPLEDLSVYKLVAGESDREMFTLGAASRASLPELPRFAAMMSHVALRPWIDVIEDQEQSLQEHRSHIHDLESRLADLDELQHRLIEAEQLLAKTVELEVQLEELRPDGGPLKRLLKAVIVRLSPRLWTALREFNRSLQSRR